MSARYEVRCVACFTPTSRPWFRYCKTCIAWLRFGQALRIMRATRAAREGAR